MAKKKKQRSHSDMVKLVEGGREITGEHLNHKETLRATSLGQAIGYYINTIVKDGDMYRELIRDNRVLKPATYMGVIEVAMAFESYLSGELNRDVESVSMILESIRPVKEAKVELEQEAETPNPTTGA